MATNFSPSSGSYVLNKFPSISQWSDTGPSWPSCLYLLVGKVGDTRNEMDIQEFKTPILISSCIKMKHCSVFSPDVLGDGLS